MAQVFNFVERFSQVSDTSVAGKSASEMTAQARGIDPLTTAAIINGTDKYGYHDYTPNYFRVLKHLRDRPLRLLEIGVGGYSDEDRGGESLAVWRDFFPMAQVTGLDIQKKTLPLGPRVHIVQGSQVDAEFLASVEAARGPFDVILDDGSHRNEHVVETFRLLFPGLVPGGIYLIEDVQTSFFPRFGGSLELTQPNSVGLFAQAMTQLSGDRDGIFDDVASIERFHNMIVIHKSPASGARRNLDASPHLLRAGEGIGDRPVKVALVGGAKLPAAFAGRDVEIIQPDWSAEWGQGPLAGLDLIVAELDTPKRSKKSSRSAGGAKVGEDTLRSLIGALRTDGGVLVVTATDPARDLAADSPVMQFAQQRFIEVDHREMRVHFPDVAIDELATQIHTIERTPDALLFVKAPNDWPSNFGYDARNPQAAEALANIRAVLAHSDVEGGLVQLLQIENRFGTPEDTRALEEKLGSMGATARRYFEHAVAQAQRRHDQARVGALLTRALENYPADPGFSAGMARHLIAERRQEDAMRVLKEGLAKTPSHRVLNQLMSKVLVAQGDIEAALPFAREAAARTPRDQRPPLQARYAKMLTQVGKWAEAERYAARAVDVTPNNDELLAALEYVRTRKPDLQ
ncbi:tetratricopeptide repeat protein [Pseudogemmobacter blasticus]|uniref:Uncharacterized protein n=1 Tax=Fuscovulum blasticum DSM 2131 TaxID=1188250 RepID=A0A2T4JF03_FUSBL|nr:tetratricopeptide repeat protein [Fuscovulum blasticum]PTE16377.1 hypothetical protein C5F44_00500 [Fuscovulum blasticum DSM 2131]